MQNQQYRFRPLQCIPKAARYCLAVLALAAAFLSLFAPALVWAADHTNGKAIPKDLDANFVKPPDDAKPRVYWFWIYNRVDKAGITRDLEQFKAKGISGVNLICTGGYAGAAPLPGVKYQSPEWWDLFRFTAQEAKRLNIELGFNLSAGGWVMEGPWLTPDNAMKKVVQADLNVEGPENFSDKLPQPEIVDGYYHDYCVQAFPRKGAGVAISPGDVIDLTTKFQPDGTLQWEVPAGKWTILRTGYTLTGEGKWYAYPDGDTFEGGGGYQIDYLSSAAFDDHFAHLGQPILDAAREAGGRLDYFWSDSWECGKLTWTQDFPNQFLKYRGYDIKPYLPVLPGALSSADYSATFTATADTHTLSFVGTNLQGGDNTVFIDNVQIKTDQGSLDVPDFGFETPSIGGGAFQYNPSGCSWTFSGSSGNGSGIAAKGSQFGNGNVPEGAQEAFIQGTGAISQAISGFIPGTTYTITFTAGQRPGNAQTWNVKMDDSVIGSYKPGTGITIINDDVTARFRADFDRTIQDCLADNCYGHFTDVCHQKGLIMGSESCGPNNIPPEDALKNLGRCDFPAGEYWASYSANGIYNDDDMMRLNLKQTATAAHVYGRPQAQAESFTMMGDHTQWGLGPSDLKPYANVAFCEGINRIMLHEATCQDPEDGKPGYEFCASQHFTPNITWWEQSPAFFTYLSRCSYMLQQGNFAADVCFYLGEEPPSLVPPKYIIPGLGAGYDCDYSNAEVLLKRMSVKDGRIVLPDGMSYRLLVLQNCVSPVPEIAKKVGSYQNLTVSPIPSKAMSVEVIKKLRELVNDGATIIGAPPVEAAGLKNYPKCDEEVKSIAAELWGNLDGETQTERSFGKGRVIWGKSPREVLLADGVAPDCTFTGQSEHPDDFDYIHRTSGDAEIYFVINRKSEPATRDFTFRVSGKQPEIYDPVSGSIRPANAFSQAGGCTTLPLEFDRYGSYFVVFRDPIANDLAGKAERNFPKLDKMQGLDGPWNVAFDPAWGGPSNVEFTKLEDWTQRSEPGIKYYSGKATYTINFDLQNYTTQRVFLDLGDVRSVAEVRLNGKNLGILWCFPWRVEITGAVQPTGNVLEVDVINLWANRVIGDLNLPKQDRVTKTHDVFRFDELTGHSSLIPSGLLGPVSVLGTEDDLTNP
jgi:hypothetical protein